jgi:hypothetical protein
MDVDLTPEGVERLRRSVAMLTRGQPGLDREAAMTVLEELQRVQLRARDLERGVAAAVDELTAAVTQLLP